MLIRSFLLIPMILAAGNELTIDNFIVEMKENTVHRISVIDESSDELNLSGLGIRSVDRNAFDKLSGLKTLILANNSLTRLPEFVFINLTNLEHLNLADNEITDFENVFFGLDNLKSLNLSNSPMKFLRKGYMHGLTKSCEIFTSGVSFLGISSGIFQNPFLRESDLRQAIENKTKSVRRRKSDDRETTEGSTKKLLSIKICKSRDIVKSVDILEKDEIISKDCKKIDVDGTDELYLTNLGISKFDKGWYRLQASSISTINLSGNNISRLTTELFNDLPENIRTVDLSGNKIERLERGIIKNNRLSVLDVSNNSIWKIDDDALQETKLMGLHLNYNKLNDTKFVASLPSTMNVIAFQVNNIKEISIGSFSKLKGLKQLCLNNNEIKELPKHAFSELSSLEILDLSNNRIAKIGTGCFKRLSNLKILHLHNNGITDVPKNAFDGLERLEELDIGRNRLTEITDDLRSSLPRNLQRLILDHNKITSLKEGSFVNVPSDTLSLNGNKISKIESGSFYLPNLTVLRLDFNLLTELNGDWFGSLGNLKFLILEANRIAKIEHGFGTHLSNLESLNLSKNPIEKLENGAFSGMPKWSDCSIFLVDVPLKVIQGGLFENA